MILSSHNSRRAEVARISSRRALRTPSKSNLFRIGPDVAIDLTSTVSPATYRRLELLWQNRTLPPWPSRTLLEIWSADKPAKMKAADQANSLLPLLTSYAPALNLAAELRGENPHLAEHEILELAGLPLRFPS